MDRERIRRLRLEYSQRADLDISTVNPDPIAQFRSWFDAAVDQGLPEPNAMTLATIGSDGAPSARMVLLKELFGGELVFYTNYESRKGRDLFADPRAALVFYWYELHRQVRIEGTVSPVTAERSDAYFATRPRGAQLSAVASAQSRAISGRELLERRTAEIDAASGGGPIARPAHWGGFGLKPSRFEFWQGRENRLHDRVQYTARGNGWEIVRLSP